MLLTDKEIIANLKIGSMDRVLDVGGSMAQHTSINIDTLVDLIRPEDSPYKPTKLRASRFIKIDFTKDKLPFKDKEFDVCLCTHVLEDLASPFLVMNEMSRVSKRGLIVTPSMGCDMVFSPIDYTNWLTGARRVPGEAHHRWFFVGSGRKLEVIPKVYPILYTENFQVTKWSGIAEMEHYWKDEIVYEEFTSINIHKLIDRYEEFINKNQKEIKISRTLYFVDNPFNLIKAISKKVLKRGAGYKYRNIT